MAEDADPGGQVTYTAISGSVSEEASENSYVIVTILNPGESTAGLACAPLWFPL